MFLRRAHEPGRRRRVLGRVYADSGVEQGRAVLADLARHRRPPATSPPSSPAISSPTSRRRPWSTALARRFLETDGDLKEVARALVTAPEAWSPERAKIKRPAEWIVAFLRATGLGPDIAPHRPRPHPCSESRYGGRRRRRASPTTTPPGSTGSASASRSPAISPSGSATASTRRRSTDTALGPLASAETRRAIERAESRPQALTMLLMSPEFLRR